MAIPDDAPGKEIAEYLRHLRRLVGEPPYRELATLSGFEHHTLSQIANGRRLPGWTSVKQYVDTILKYAARRGIDLAEAMRPHTATHQVDPALCIVEQARVVHTRLVARRGEAAAAARAAEAGEQSLASAEQLAVTEPPAAVPLQPALPQLAGPEVPESLAEVRRLHDLVAALNDMIADQGWDLSMRAWDIHRRKVPRYLMSDEALDALTSRRPLSILIFARILEASGAAALVDGVLRPYRPEWGDAWNRVTLNERPELTASPAAMPAEGTAVAGAPLVVHNAATVPPRPVRWRWRLWRLIPKWLLSRWPALNNKILVIPILPNPRSSLENDLDDINARGGLYY